MSHNVPNLLVGDFLVQINIFKPLLPGNIHSFMQRHLLIDEILNILHSTIQLSGHDSIVVAWLLFAISKIWQRIQINGDWSIFVSMRIITSSECNWGIVRQRRGCGASVWVWTSLLVWTSLSLTIHHENKAMMRKCRLSVMHNVS